MSIMDSFSVDQDGVNRMADIIAEKTGVSLGCAKEAAEEIRTQILVGDIQIEMKEGWDSCAACGGYHSIHKRCS